MNLLVISLADIGDLLLTTPALSAIRASLPDAHIDVLTSPHAAPILSGTGLADAVITFDRAIFDSVRRLFHPRNFRPALALWRRLRAGKYDAVFICHRLTTRLGALKYAVLSLATGAPKRLGVDNGTGRGWFLTDRVADQGFGGHHQADYWLSVAGLLGARIDHPVLRIGISELDRAWAHDHLPDHPRLIAIHPGSGGFSAARRWEPEKFAGLADRLADAGAQIVIVGGADDDSETVIGHMRHAPLNLAGQTTLGQLAAVLERCECFYGADSGVMHVATATGTQVNAIFGPSNHEAWGPYAGNARIIRSGARCSPCFYVGNGIGLREGCPARTCLKTVTVEDVLDPTPSALTPNPSPEGKGSPATPV